MAAGLALEARVLLGRLADGFLVAGLRARGVDLHVETALEAFDRQLQMDLALAAQQHLVGVAVVLQHQRGILLAELGDAGGELHLVLAVVRPDCQAEHRFRRLRPEEAGGRTEARLGTELAGPPDRPAPERTQLPGPRPPHPPVLATHSPTPDA